MLKHLQTTLLALIIMIMPLTACAKEDSATFKHDTITIETQAGPLYAIDVELALTKKQQAQGLMHRESLDSDKGMIFFFPKESIRSFWMKNTLIPLDMIFIDKTGKIVHIHSNARPLDETHITTPKPALAVLEINGGQSDKWNIKAGDKIIHPGFRNVLAQ